MRLWTAIQNIATANPTADPSVLAEGLLRQYRKSDLVELMAEEIAHSQRSVVRGVEVDTFRDMFAGGVGSARRRPQLESLAGFRDLFDLGFKLGDGNEVQWRTATIEQHERRILFLEKLRDGIDRTIERHREAVRLCRLHGVQSLGEIEVAA